MPDDVSCIAIYFRTRIIYFGALLKDPVYLALIVITFSGKLTTKAVNHISLADVADSQIE
jgi:hypothetical protein